MKTQRTRLQGVLTIVRFNWHFYAIAFAAAAALLILVTGLIPLPLVLTALFLLAAFGIIFSSVLSLVASYWAYDASELYQLKWLDPSLKHCQKGANIHAGFDETSHLLRQIHPTVEWLIYDFYDPEKHTEVSIKRARAAYPPAPDTIPHSTSSFPVEGRKFDIILLTLSAHEIRDTRERVDYFKALSASLNHGGKIVVTEHLRDIPNMLVYNLGALHFHTSSEWLTTFKESELSVIKRIKPAPLITTFILSPHADTH